MIRKPEKRMLAKMASNKYKIYANQVWWDIFSKGEEDDEYITLHLSAPFKGAASVKFYKEKYYLFKLK